MRRCPLLGKDGAVARESRERKQAKAKRAVDTTVGRRFWAVFYISHRNEKPIEAYSKTAFWALEFANAGRGVLRWQARRDTSFATIDEP